MIRKSLLTTHLLVVLLMSSLSFALPAPKYLSVPHWKSCVRTVTKGSAKFVCLPAKKPLKCPADSWKTLMDGHMIDPCK
ncbi:MAG: hypothetical protein JO149_03245 [Gammaproteobacteria bacterium]|nr:hypothetical protein [Gammaproteobacteria bacterium]